MPEQTQIKTRPALAREVAENFPDHAGEFEPVAGAGAGDEPLRAAGMTVDPEMLVGRVGVQAHRGRAQRAIGAGQETAHDGASAAAAAIFHMAERF